MPLLGKYLVFTMILITLSVCATVGVLNIHFRTPSTHSMSPWAKRWCIEILPKYLFMNVPQYQSQPADSSPILPEQLIYPHNAAYQSLAGDWSALVQAAQQRQRQQQQQQQPSQQSQLQPRSANNNQPAGNRANLGAAMQLLEVNKLSHQSSTSSSFLPYLTSEAARRLQMQRSRSSERASSNNCDSAANSSSNTNNNNNNPGNPGSNPGSNVGNHVGALKQHSAGTCDTAAPPDARPGRRQKSSALASGKSVGKKGAPFWRIFGGQNAPDKATTARRGSLEATNGSSSREPQPQKQSAGSRETCFSPPSSSSSSSSESSESEHDYRHHNHFQARASICSTNMWRIGPTRRCSLAVAAAAANQPNYSTFYRPLAHLSGNLGQPLVANNSNNTGARPGQVALNTIAGRLHAAQLNQQQQHSSGEQAGDSAGSSESPLMGGFRSAVSALASAAATNLPLGVRAMNSRAPSCGSQQQQGPRQLRAEACLMPGANRHLQQVFPAPPLTSCVGQQQQQQRELAARGQILQPASLARQAYLCSPQPTPPPPPPLPPDIYVEQQRLAAAQAGSGLSQAYTGAPSRQAPATTRLGQPQLVSRQHSAASSNQSAAGAGYRSGASFETAASNTGSSSTATTVMMLGERQPIQFRALNPSQLQQLPYQQPQMAQWMPRSRSTDHRLCQLYAPALAPAAAAVREPAEVASHQARPTSCGQRHTIGRALGQVYVQQLQRQPSICSGAKPMMMNGSQSAMRHSRLSMHKAHAQADLRSAAAATAPPDECLMMMRRSKSHSNLQNYPLQQRNNNHQYRQQQQYQPQVGYRQASQFAARHQCNQQPGLTAQRNADCDGCSAWCAALGAPRALSAAGTMAGRKATPQAGCVCHSAQEHEPPVQLAAADAIARAKLNCSRNSASTDRRKRSRSPLTPFGFMKLISEVDKAIQNAMFIAQHIDNLDEFESVSAAHLPLSLGSIAEP